MSAAVDGPRLVVLPGTTALADALAAMATAGVGVAVVAGPEGDAAATVTDGELRSATLAGAGPQVAVADVPHGEVPWVGPDDDDRDLAHLLERHHLDAVPVVAAGRPTGVRRSSSETHSMSRRVWSICTTASG